MSAGIPSRVFFFLMFRGIFKILEFEFFLKKEANLIPDDDVEVDSNASQMSLYTNNKIHTHGQVNAHTRFLCNMALSDMKC